jgi:predicted CoA-binding protein
MILLKQIEDFLANKEIAVVGATDNKKKFGYIVFSKLKNHGYTVYPVNPRLTEIDGIKCYQNIESIPDSVKAAVFITKPEITEKITTQICERNMINHLWFQQGAENDSAIQTALSNNKNVIFGECILMQLKSSGFPHNFHRSLRKLFGKYPK